MEDWSNNALLLEADDGGFHVDDCVYEEDEIGYAVDVDDESLPWEQHVERVQTATGVVQVTVCGNRGNPPLITYHDVGLNHSTCFQGLMLCADTSVLLLRNFCIFHVDAPGHEEDAEEIPSSQPLLCADDLAEQVAEVARHFALADVTLMGVTAGAYVLTLFALSHRHLVRGLILVSPLLSPPSWSEWAHNKVTMSVLSYYGMTSYIKDSLLDRYFCPATAGFHGPASDALLSFRRELDYHEPENLMRYFYAIHRRRNLLPGLAALQVPVLVGVGDSSPFNPLARTAFHHLHSKVPLLAPGAPPCSSPTASPSPSPASSSSPSPSHSNSDFLSEEERGVEDGGEEGGRDMRYRRCRDGLAAMAECYSVGGGRMCEGECGRGQMGSEGSAPFAVAGEWDGGREESRTGMEQREWEERSVSECGRESEEESRRRASEGGSSSSCKSDRDSRSICKGEGGSSSRSVVWVEVEACGSLVTEERPHTLLPALCHFISQLRPAGSHPWDCCEHAGEDGEERSGYGREWAVGHVEEGASVRWVGGKGRENEHQDQQQWQHQQQWHRLVNAQQHEQQQQQAVVQPLSTSSHRSYRNSAFCIPLFRPTSSQQQQHHQQYQQKQHQQQQSLSCTLPSPTLSQPLKSPSASGSHLPSPSSIPPLISPSSSSPSTSTPSHTTPSLCTPFWTPACTPAALSPAFTPAAVSPVCIPPPALNHPPMVHSSSISSSSYRRSNTSPAGTVASLRSAAAAAARGQCQERILGWEHGKDASRVWEREREKTRDCKREWERVRECEREREKERTQMFLEAERRKLQPVRTSGEARRWEEEEAALQTWLEEVCGSPTS